MSLGDLYPAILTLVLAGMILGVGLVVLDKFGGTVTSSTASQAINDTRDAIDDFATWFSVFVVVIAAAIILALVVRSFRND